MLPKHNTAEITTRTKSFGFTAVWFSLEPHEVSVMARLPNVPPMDGLRRRIRQSRQDAGQRGDSFVRETFCLPRVEARAKAKEWFRTWPRAAYWTEVESWRQLPDDQIEFTMRRLPSAD